MSGNNGNLVWRILFGVLIASLVLGIFLTYTQKQKEYSTGKKAEQLADKIARIAFSSDSGSSSIVKLPKTIGNSKYEFDVENNKFIIKITTGGQKGEIYESFVGTNVKEIEKPKPGEKIYTAWKNNEILVSSRPIREAEIIEPKNKNKPPEFYKFAKNNPLESSALISSYQYLKKIYPNKENIEIRKYEWVSKNIIKARATNNGKFLTAIKTSGKENNENIGHIYKSWVVKTHENTKKELQSSKRCPSVKKAYFSKWFIVPKEAKSNFKERTWTEKEENQPLKIENVSLRASTVYTKVSSYPTWGIKFESKNSSFTVHLSMVFWKADENEPCFVFESETKLEAKI